MIKQHTEILQKEVEHLKQQLTVYEVQQKEMQERQAQVEKQEELLTEQIKQLSGLLHELAQTPTSNQIAPLHQQISAVTVGNKDVDSARRRFAGLQKAAQEAQQKLREEEQRQRERVEWLQKQIELYQVKGMSPAQKSYRNYLKDVKRLTIVQNYREHSPHPLRCFISYAWETDPKANKELQERLTRLKDDLEVAGMEVVLDLRDMKGDMKKFMNQGIRRAHKLLLVCTPRLRERALECTKNNLQFELKTALKKEKSTPGFIVPLLFSGNFQTAMPPQVAHLLAIRLLPQVQTHLPHPLFILIKEDYHTAIAGLSPMGIIPMLMQWERNREYRRILDRFDFIIFLIKKRQIAKENDNKFRLCGDLEDIVNLSKM
jgi:hypothetical protein